MPFPTPPSRRVLSAAETVAKRSGLTVLMEPKHGLILWAVARTAESAVLGVRSGWITEAAAGAHWGNAYREAAHAVSELAVGAHESVFSVAESVGERFLRLGFPVDLSYPPAAGVVATEKAVAERLDSLFSRLEIATDASIGHRTPWAGHGWVLDFGRGLPLRPGLKAVAGGSILESELRAIRLALGAAKNAYTGILDGRCAVTVSSDNLAAVNMLQDDIHAGQTTAACREEIQRIKALAAFADIHFRWVKGHSDHELNVLADRLAVMSRRHKEAALPAHETLRMAAGVVEQRSMGLAA